MSKSAEVFISWSGDTSKRIAEELGRWLPLVVESPRLWLSSRDIPDGARWSRELFQSLERSQCGVLVLTPNNVNSTWMLFEAGALSKNLDEGRVIPFLCGIKPSQLQGPLAHFQAVTSEESGVRSLVHSINSFCPEPASESIITSRFDAFWPKFNTFLSTVDISSDTPASLARADSPTMERLENRLAEAMDMIRDLAAGLNTATRVESGTESTDTSELSKLEGAWTFSPSGSHAYARMIDGDLRVPYCFRSNDRLVGEYYGWTRTGDYWLCRFRWFDRQIHGFGLYRQVSADKLEGTWWGDYVGDPTSIEEIEKIVNNVESFKGGTPLTWRRRHEYEIPSWASDFWDRLVTERETG